MGILDIEIVKGFMRMCNDGWLQGWHERNGGNLTSVSYTHLPGCWV